MALYRTDKDNNVKKIAGNYGSDKNKANRSADNLSESDLINWKNKLNLDNKTNVNADNLTEENVENWKQKLDINIYTHYISLISWEMSTFVITTNKTPFTYQSFAQYLHDNGIIDNTSKLMVSGLRSNGSQWLPRSGIYCNDGINIMVNSSTGGSTAIEVVPSQYFYDNVIKIN